MMIYPAVHYTMGGIWVDYNLMTTIPGLYAIGEANFSDHGANRLGASALMQGLADGYFVLPYTIGDYLSERFQLDQLQMILRNLSLLKRSREKLDTLINNKGSKSVDYFHKNSVKSCGISVEWLEQKRFRIAIIEISKLRKEFWKEVKVPGDQMSLMKNLPRLEELRTF